MSVGAAKVPSWAADWDSRLALATHPLPGCVPYRGVRTLGVQQRFDGLALIDFLVERHPHLGRERWLGAIGAGAISIDGRCCMEPARVVRGGNQLKHELGVVVEPPVARDLRLLYADRHMVVIDKPAPLPVHASGRFYKNVAVGLLARMYPRHKFHPVHRLDADVSGVQVFALTSTAADRLTKQFAARSVEKRYLARVDGAPSWQRRQVEMPIGRAVAENGGRALAEDGQGAQTELQVIRRAADGTALLELVPLTGRTHQLRLHLAAIGLPILGDTLYGATPAQPPGRAGAGAYAARRASAGAICLTARRLVIEHPQHGTSMIFEANLPNWAGERD